MRVVSLSRVKNMFELSRSMQLTLVLSTGLGCGILIGVLLAGRRRKPSLAVTGRTSTTEQVTDDFGHVSGEFKMVFVVRNDLKMGKGKIAAQCGHAAIGAYKEMTKSHPDILHQWERMGCAKVVVKAPDEQTFLKVVSDSLRLGLNTHVVRDAGRTQIAPGSKTVLSVGPGPAEQVDIATGSLKLL